MTEIIVLLLLAVMTTSVMGLVALWAGMIRRHWFLRVAVVGAVLSLWLIIPAYEILAALFVQATVVIVSLSVVRIVRTGRLRFQFAVRDLLLLTVVVAAILSVAISAPKDVWRSSYTFWVPRVVFILYGIGAGLVTLVAAWVALGQGRRRLRLAALCLIPPTWLLAGWLALLRAARWIKVGKRPEDSPVNEAVAEKRRSALTWVARISVVLVSALVLLPLAFVYYQVGTPPPIPPVKLPNPNGYNDLVRAGELLRQVAVPDVDTASPGELRAFVTRYRHVFDTARRGLGRECQVPIEYTWDYTSEQVLRVQGFRALARAFLAEGKLAETEGRTADAVESYLDTIHLGRAVADGALIPATSFGPFFVGMGSRALNEMKDTLTAAQCRQIISTLETAGVDGEPLENVYEREAVWFANTFGWRGRLHVLVSEWLPTDADRKWNIEQARKYPRAMRRLEICGLALQGHRAENGNFPAHLADLVPGYLSAVPADPFSGKPLIYRRQPTGYLLYSIGPDGNDDAGWPIDYNIDRGDIRLDPPPEGETE